MFKKEKTALIKEITEIRSGLDEVIARQREKPVSENDVDGLTEMAERLHECCGQVGKAACMVELLIGMLQKEGENLGLELGQKETGQKMETLNTCNGWLWEIGQQLESFGSDLCYADLDAMSQTSTALQTIIDCLQKD